jgi:hypothetical protein
MASLQIKSVAIVRPLDGGPDEVSVVTETDAGAPVDFNVLVPRGKGEEYAASLGVTEYTLSEPKIVSRADAFGRQRKIVEGAVPERKFAAKGE